MYYKGDLTQDVLRSIARHLSSRKDCRKVEYRVVIGKSTSDHSTFHGTDSINFETAVRLRDHNFRGMSHPAIQHIMMYHFSKLCTGSQYGNDVNLYDGVLTHGVYVYTLSSSGKSRKWVKVS